MRLTSFHSRGLLLSALVALAACDQVTGIGDDAAARPPTQLQVLECVATPRAKTVSCAEPGAPAGARGLLFGGQGQYVQLTSSNITYDGGTGAFEFDVTVQNLIPQTMGTADGSTPTAEGVRAFFHIEPHATTGTGDIVVNAEGTGTFTGSNQPYYQYSGTELGADELLTSQERSSPVRWSFTIPGTVETFAFNVAVATEVQYPDGYVDVVPGVDTVTAGTPLSLAATVRSAVGNDVGGTVAWSTSDAAVATVDAAGNVTTLAPGAVTITAVAGARSGSASLAVCPDLDVGEVYTATMPGAASLCFAGGASGAAEYTYMPVNLSTSSALSLSVTAAGIQAVTGPPTPNRIPGGTASLSLGDGAALAAADARHLAALDRDRALARSLLADGARIVRRSRRGGPRMQIVQGTPALGDLWTLNVGSACAAPRDDRTARVVSIGSHVIIVADTMNPAGGFTTAQYDSIRLEFDTIAYPVDSANFGAPTDTDGNERVVVFYTRGVNELTPPATAVVNEGYFASRDLFSAAPEECPGSNEGEILYMGVPDPTGAVNSNVRTVSAVRGAGNRVLTHELQHLINASRRVYVNGATDFEETWLNEGLSHVAEELVFYRTAPGLAPRSNIILSNLNTGPSASRRVAAYNTYQNGNFTRLRTFLQRPDTAGPLKTGADVGAVRGATWAFLRYAADRKNGVETSFWFDLVNSTTTGQANLQNVLADDPNAWGRDWIAAMYADDAVAGIATQYQNLSWNFRSVYGGLGGFPLLARPLSNGLPLTLSYSRGAGTSYLRFGVATGGFAGVTALSGGSVPSSPYALIVVRTK